MSSRHLSRIAAVIAALGLATVVPAHGPCVDPKDGPDVDLRVSVEDTAVVFEITTNLAFLDEFCDVPRELDETLALEEEELAREELLALFKDANRITIDGAEVQPVDRGFAVDPGDPSLVPHYPLFGARAVFKTRITLAYPCKQPPRRVAIAWGPFPPLTILENEDGEPPLAEVLCHLKAGGVAKIVKLRHDEPEYTWHRDDAAEAERFAAVPELVEQEAAPLPWPWIGSFGAALGLLALGPRKLRRAVFGPLALVLGAMTVVKFTASRPVVLPTADEAVAIFQPLHANIYRAFDYTDESAVYDALAQSVDGALLDRLYNEVYRSLVMQEEGGAVSRVETVRNVDTSVEEIGVLAPDGLPGFRVDARWQVDGAVFHWNHGHTRTNEYRARYTVRATEDGWRIADSEVLEQFRVDAAPLPDGEF